MGQSGITPHDLWRLNYHGRDLADLRELWLCRNRVILLFFALRARYWRGDEAEVES